MDWGTLLFPLINLGTQITKQYVFPRVPRAVLPLANIALGVGLAYGTHALGLPGLDPATLSHCVEEGLAAGGLATVAHNVNKNLGR